MKREQHSKMRERQEFLMISMTSVFPDLLCRKFDDDNFNNISPNETPTSVTSEPFHLPLKYVLC